MKRGKKIKIAILVLLVLMMVTALFANYYVKKHGYKNLGHFISSYYTNKNLAADAKFETLEIKIDPSDFEKLELERKKALERGLLVKEGNTYVKAKLKHKGKKIKAEIRLKGHMTDHLQDKKWSFRIKTKGGDAFMGMKVFSIQHPGTRNYIYEWIYHQMMKEEGIIALNYDFIKVLINGEDWGIYAVEEHFAQELVQRNHRPKGPLLRFNPEMYWSGRIAELEKRSFQMESASFQSANLEVYDDNNSYKDSSILKGFQRANVLMEIFRNGQATTSQIFDYKKLAKFHAVIDLVGGHHSLDWSDVKYYYNSLTDKIEPVAYESFSVQNTNAICGADKFAIIEKGSLGNFHVKLFSDPVFYAEYIKELTRIASKKWLDLFLKKNDKLIQSKLAIIYKDYALKNYSSDPYYKNVKLIDGILNPKKGVHAYVNEVKNDSIVLGVAGIDALPFELLQLTIDTVSVKLLGNTIIACKLSAKPMNYQKVTARLPGNLAAKISSDSKIELTYRLLGGNKILETRVLPIPSFEDGYKVKNDLDRMYNKSDIASLDFLSVDQNARVILFHTGKLTIDKPIFIPEDYKVFIEPNTSIDFVKGGKLVSYSPIIAKGTDEEPVAIYSSDMTGRGISIVQSKIPSVFYQIKIHGLGSKSNIEINNSAITLYESEIRLKNCFFYDNNGSDLFIVKGKALVDNVTFSNSKKDAIVFLYATGEVSASNFMNTGDDAIDITGSSVKVNNSNFKSIQGVALSSKSESVLIVKTAKILQATVGILSSDNSLVKASGMDLAKCTTALKANQKGDVYGPSTIIVYDLKQDGNKRLKEIEKGSIIKILKQ